MLIGDPSKFAIESGITVAYEDRGFVASGYFLIYANGICYGEKKPYATYLGTQSCRILSVIKKRGTNVAPFSTHPDAGEIADAYRDALYAPDPENLSFLGIPYEEFGMYFINKIHWIAADEGFADESYVLIFDVGSRVRLIAFKLQAVGHHHDPATLADLWLEADEFYGTLNSWHQAVMEEWERTPKSPD